MPILYREIPSGHIPLINLVKVDKWSKGDTIATHLAFINNK